MIDQELISVIWSTNAALALIIYTISGLKISFERKRKLKQK